MHEGTPIPRQFLLVSNDGHFVIDWGDEKYQDLFSGERVDVKGDVELTIIKPEELAWLKKTGTISHFDDQTVFIYSLPSFKDT